MRTAACVLSAVIVLVFSCARSSAQGVVQPTPAASGYDDDMGIPGAVPTKQALRPIPGYPQGGAVPVAGSSGAYQQKKANSQYPASRNYYDYSPNAARPDSYGRMRSSGGQDVDVRGDQMGVNWYRNMPERNYDYRDSRY